MDIKSTVKLNNNVEMPLLGLGTWQLPNSKAPQVVQWALEKGYRHIDTAAIYGNEEGVGKGIKNSKIPRKEIFVTTKLWNDDHKNPEKALNDSLKKLGMDYVDLYLIHWPVPKSRNNAWKALEGLYKEGKCRAIGVSNFTIRHLNELMEISDVIPAVNQVEFHPWLYQKELWEFCKKNKIQLESYSPLTHGKKLKDKTLLEIANKYSKTGAQILIKWELQKNIVVIPKSEKKERIIENSNVYDFEISAEDMKKLDSLNENLRTCWNPEGYETW